MRIHRKEFEGSYSGVVELSDGMNIEGGYDTNWQPDDRNLPGHQVRILGGSTGRPTAGLPGAAGNVLEIVEQ